MSTKKQINHITYRLMDILGSRKFFILIVFIFIVQAGWLALSASYPMLYDEYYHPAVIDFYSRQLSPFIGSQTPETTALYGDLTRAPSYLYHYLLSFPYRVVTNFSDSFYVAIVSLRLINVAFVAIGLVLFRRLLIEIGLSKATTHSSLLILILLPIFPHVAAHVNYDNLLFALTPLFLLYGLRSLRDKSPNIINLSLFLSIGALASIVKFSFLPVFATASLYVGAAMLKKHKDRLPSKIFKNFGSQTLMVKIVISLLMVVSVGLFAERHIGNIVSYRDLQPKCEILQPKSQCDEQPIVKRGKIAREQFKDNPVPLDNLMDYTTQKWLPGMITGSSFVYANVGSEEKLGMTVKANERGAPLPIMHVFLTVALGVSVFFVAYSWRSIRKMPDFWFFFVIFLVYLVSLWILTNYLGYRKSGQAFAIQPRYFLILMPLMIGYVAQAISIKLHQRVVKVALILAILVVFTQGGGVATYIVRSNEGWYWQRQDIIDLNMDIKRTIAPFINEK